MVPSRSTSDSLVHTTSSLSCAGITDLVLNNRGQAEITDDTQMTIFTAEGLLRARSRGEQRGLCHTPGVVYYAYLRWLHTQGYPRDHKFQDVYNSWLLEIPHLFATRAPGNSCLSALLSGKMGTIEEPINNSKGCGGVMRVAPIGLFCLRGKAFRTGAECAAITHGHPSGYLSAGALAAIIAAIIDGNSLEQAVLDTLSELQTYQGHEECTISLRNALYLAHSDYSPADAIQQLGQGWVGEEALAIAVYCALKFQHDFRGALIASVNHSGDSDSTGSITGNILGAYLGVSAIPAQWLKNIELADVITQLANDLLMGFEETEEWISKYPGY